MTIPQFISTNNLQPADAVELICPQAGFPKHYAVYLGNKNGVPKFVANITDGIQILSSDKLAEFIKKYHVTNIERFRGSHQQRVAAIKRVFTRLGEKAYNLVFNNCEHFKNWVLNGEGISKQVTTIATGTAVTGASLYLLGMALDNKGAKKAGGIILVLLVIIAVIAFVMWQHKQNRDNELNNDVTRPV